MASPLALACLLLAFKVEYVSDSDDSQCFPVRALFIWPESDNEASHRQQRRFVLAFIKSLPDGSSIFLIIIGDKKIKKINFTKDSKYENYLNNIAGHFSFSTNNTITYKVVSAAMSKFFDQNKSTFKAEEIFFIVNENTHLDNETKIKNAVDKKKRYVIIHGYHSPGDVWSSVALDEKHIQELGEDEKAIDFAVKSVKHQTCKDSLFVCDIHQYQTGEMVKAKCYNCSYICPQLQNLDSEYCSRKCPYYRYHTQKVKQDGHQSKDPSLRKIENQVTFNTITIWVFIVTCLGLFIFCKRKEILQRFQRRPRYSSGKHSLQESRLSTIVPMRPNDNIGGEEEEDVLLDNKTTDKSEGNRPNEELPSQELAVPNLPKSK